MLEPTYCALKCPACGKGVSVFAAGSGNTFVVHHWTDGKTETPYLRQNPWLIKCPFCQSCFWINEAEDITENPPVIETFSDGEVLRNALRIKFRDIPEENDYFRILQEDLTKDKEIEVRVNIWHASNDPFRYGECDVRAPFSAEQEENLRRLLRLFEDDDPYQKVLKAEIQRELGEFSTATNLCLFLKLDHCMVQRGDNRVLCLHIQTVLDLAFKNKREVAPFKT